MITYKSLHKTTTHTVSRKHNKTHKTLIKENCNDIRVVKVKIIVIHLSPYFFPSTLSFLWFCLYKGCNSCSWVVCFSASDSLFNTLLNATLQNLGCLWAYVWGRRQTAFSFEWVILPFNTCLMIGLVGKLSSDQLGEKIWGGKKDMWKMQVLPEPGPLKKNAQRYLLKHRF